MKLRKIWKILATMLTSVMAGTILAACSVPPEGTVQNTGGAQVSELPKVTETSALTAAPTEAPALTSAPTPTPTQVAAETPSPAPTGTPTPEPTETPSPAPTATPTPEPTATPSPAPTATPTPQPTATPSPAPTATPTPRPTPTAAHSPTPTAAPDGTYTTLGSVKYTASGYSGVSGDTFSFSSRMTLTFASGTLAGSFNRLSFTYTSAKPLKIYVTYLQNGAEQTDYYYLEAGSDRTFSGLITSYLSGGRGSTLRTVTLETLNGANSFRLSDVAAETVTVYNDKLYFLENDRFKLGIQLSWGGGLNYIQDKTCTVPGLTNLVNRHDTGRLIQQSYYGTGGNSEYTPGDFNGTRWSYNPVQGGDKYGNASRLIDVRVTADSVYIKAQPQDWSLNGQLTRSYIENVYTLTDEYIRVDNRFVDFSGWTHPSTHQELPAFYTVSYLDRFTWYNGDNGWTGGKLTRKDNLPFWGDPNYAAGCRFFITEPNTETWCAWVSSADDFGLGLYVPNIDMLYAGRYQYNGSKSDQNDATNYVAPLMQLQIVSFEPIEYSYLITAGSTEAIRATFTAHKDFADNASLHNHYKSMRVPGGASEPSGTGDPGTLDFSDSGNLSVVTGLYNTIARYSESQRALELMVKAPHDPQAMIDYRILSETLYAEDYSALEIEYMVPESASLFEYACDLFLCTGNKVNPDGSERTRVTLQRTGTYQKVRIELSELAFWKGTVNCIRFDYFDLCAEGDTIYVKSFNLVP